MTARHPFTLIMFLVFLLPSLAVSESDLNKNEDVSRLNCNELGIFYYRLGPYEEQEFNKPTKTDAFAHYNLGVAYSRTGNTGAAVEQYRILRNLDTELANRLFNLICGAHRGRPDVP
jgi:hypothetical protein